MSLWRRWTYCDEPGCDARTTDPRRDGWTKHAHLDYCRGHEETRVVGPTPEVIEVLNRIRAEQGLPPRKPTTPPTPGTDTAEVLW